MKRLVLPAIPTLLLVAACSTTPAFAPPPTSLVQEPAVEGSAAPEERGVEEEEFREHAVSVFLGGATNEADHSGFAFGADYEYRFNPTWGVAAFGEWATGDLRAFVGGALAVFHPTESLALVAGPGFERERGDEFGDAEWFGIFRLGALYEFRIARGWAVAPALYYDFSGGENTLVYGINFATAF